MDASLPGPGKAVWVPKRRTQEKQDEWQKVSYEKSQHGDKSSECSNSTADKFQALSDDQESAILSVENVLEAKLDQETDNVADNECTDPQRMPPRKSMSAVAEVTDMMKQITTNNGKPKWKKKGAVTKHIGPS
ncbi:hypothetical protein CCACVL1_18135, partial [Corchorus capsularis]